MKGGKLERSLHHGKARYIGLPPDVVFPSLLLLLNHPRQSCQGTLGKGGNFIVDIIAAVRRSLGIDMIFPI